MGRKTPADLGAASDSPLQSSQLFDARHGIQPDVVFRIWTCFGAQAGRILVVGCQPASLGSMGLSRPSPRHR